MNTCRKFLVPFVLGTCLFILSRGFLDFFLSRGDGLTSGNPVMRLILTVTYFAVVMVLAPYLRDTFFVFRRNWFLVALLLMAFVSCLWVETPALAFQRSIAVLGASLLGIALAVRLTLEEQLRLMNWMFRIMAVLSLVCVLFFPAYGISQLAESQGEWQGIFNYKNELGSMMAMSILVEWHLPTHALFSKFAKWAAVLISTILLYFSNSVTPLIALVTTLLIVEIYKFANHRFRVPLYAIVLVILLIIASGATVLAVDRESATGVLGRSSNLTGRTAIWSMVTSFIMERPVLGYGYAGFWYGSSPQSEAVDQALGEPIMYSHNGYLEILLGLGAVGFLFTLIFLGTGMKRAYYFSERERCSETLWPLAFFLFFLFYNLGECTILLQDLQWALCVSVVAGTDAALLAPRLQMDEEELLCAPVAETL
jgi:exopolysaccharide production protein ExoQ